MHLLAKPGVALKDIRTIESHPMAIRQCSEYLHSLNDIEIRESDDTALSAKKICEQKIKNVAAIANEQAANRFGLNVLVRHIETHKKNFTRFLLLTKKRNGTKSSNKASLCFEVANEVGSLADALMIFKKNRINLSKIQSVPVIGKPREYSIHIDIEWKHREDYENAMKKVLREVHNLSVLGEYKKAKIKF
jgi:prephenate dehydratase